MLPNTKIKAIVNYEHLTFVISISIYYIFTTIKVVGDWWNQLNSYSRDGESKINECIVVMPSDWKNTRPVLDGVYLSRFLRSDNITSENGKR